jgi:hypothetical protein
MSHDGDTVDNIETLIRIGSRRIRFDPGKVRSGEVFLIPGDGGRVDVATVKLLRHDELSKLRDDSPAAATPIQDFRRLPERLVFPDAGQEKSRQLAGDLQKVVAPADSFLEMWRRLRLVRERGR